MKYLLTSAGARNKSIHNALVEMLGKPIADSIALCIPAAKYGHHSVGPSVKTWEFISGNSGALKVLKYIFFTATQWIS